MDINTNVPLRAAPADFPRPDADNERLPGLLIRLVCYAAAVHRGYRGGLGRVRLDGVRVYLAAGFHRHDLLRRIRYVSAAPPPNVACVDLGYSSGNK